MYPILCISTPEQGPSEITQGKNLLLHSKSLFGRIHERLLVHNQKVLFF